MLCPTEQPREQPEALCKSQHHPLQKPASPCAKASITLCKSQHHPVQKPASPCAKASITLCRSQHHPVQKPASPCAEASITLCKSQHHPVHNPEQISMTRLARACTCVHARIRGARNARPPRLRGSAAQPTFCSCMPCLCMPFARSCLPSACSCMPFAGCACTQLESYEAGLLGPQVVQSRLRSLESRLQHLARSMPLIGADALPQRHITDEAGA